uniref:Uncharacterized protein n=1 Tax=Rhinolophus ferrumequinum TaxID=59479 RepID=A0A671EDL4_RHIFE
VARCQPLSSFMYMHFPREIFTQIRGAIVRRFSFTIDDLVSLSRAHIDYKCLHGLISIYWFIGINVCYWFNSNCLSNYSLPICHKCQSFFRHHIFDLIYPLLPPLTLLPCGNH